ncbi:MAG: hypothetical protein ACLFRX_10380 [Gemmatimonadota bacterium]
MPLSTSEGMVARCRSCGAEVDARVQVCPECGACCPGCTAEGLRLRVKRPGGTPVARRPAIARSSPCGKLLAMHEELGHALMEATWELDNLPVDMNGAISRMYAVMDDLRDAIDRTIALDEQG